MLVSLRMDIFGGRSLKDLIHFYDRQGNRTMIKRIHDLIQDIEEDLDPDYVAIDSEGSEEEEEGVKEVLHVKRSDDGFYSLA